MSKRRYTEAELLGAVHDATQKARLAQIGRSATIMQQLKERITELETENTVLKHKLEVAEFGEEAATSALRDEHQHALELERIVQTGGGPLA